MKLKTKFQDEDFELGEVVEANVYYGGSGRIKVLAEPTKGGVITLYFESLKGLNDMFEDDEEPKDYWYIDTSVEADVDFMSDKPSSKSTHDEGVDKFNEEIGNYFESKTEAKKAVEKLKAWKRLKDIGITFKNWTINQTGTIDCFATWGDNIPPSRKNPTLLEDLDLLFGGEE